MIRKDPHKLRIFSLTNDKQIIQLSSLKDFDDRLYRQQWRTPCMLGIVTTAFLAIPSRDISDKLLFFETACFCKHDDVLDQDNYDNLQIIAQTPTYKEAMNAHILAIQRFGGTLGQLFSDL